MRLKHFWNVVPIPAKFKLFADRITFSKLTIFYFVFSILNCIIQVIFQVQAFKINENAANFLNSLIVQGNVSENGFPVLEANELRWCMGVPNRVNDVSSCQVVWDGSAAQNASLALDDNAVDYVGSSSSPLTASSSASSIFSSNVPQSSSSTSSSSSSISPSSSSTPVSSSSSASATRTVTSTVHVTVSDIAQLQSALQVAEASSIDPLPSSTAASVTATVTKTVQTVPQPSPDSNDNDALAHRKRTPALQNPHIISAINVDGSQQVKVVGLPGSDGEITLSESCLVSLNWPLGSVDNTKREDVVFIGFSIWVLGMSLVALLNESPPHIIATFLTHCLATGWSAFQITNTNSFHSDFTRLTTHGACGVNLLPTYWTARAQFEIPTLAMNVLALIVSAVLSWKLMKSFGWQTFKRIGASLTMSRAYRIILIFSIVIQLSVFFIVVAVALWVDQVYNGDIGHLTKRATMFKAITFSVLFMIFPWLTIGWISVRREHKLWMIVFLVLSFGYLVGWSSMFLAPSFRWTFVEWRFFSVMATASVVLSLVALVLGIVCRCNFGRGLSRYLNAQQPLPGDDFEPATLEYDPSASASYITEKGSSWGSDEEKIDFPSYDTSLPIPTYASVPPPPPAHMQMAPRTLGPRFYAQQGNPPPFEQVPQISVDTSGQPQPQQVRLPPLSRQSSGSSQRSVGSNLSMDSTHRDSPLSMRGKRWVIE